MLKIAVFIKGVEHLPEWVFWCYCRSNVYAHMATHALAERRYFFGGVESTPSLRLVKAEDVSTIETIGEFRRTNGAKNEGRPVSLISGLVASVDRSDLR